MQTIPQTIETLSHATALFYLSDEEQKNVLHLLNVSPFDTTELSASVDGGIKEVREFSNQMLLSPQFGNFRLGVVYNAELLTPQAQNALLKLLEEPPFRAKILLFIQREASVLPTVLSRCQKYYASSRIDETDAQLPAYNTDTLAQFVAAEDLAKREDLSDLAAAWLVQSYESWCKLGRPSEGVADVQRFWDFYQSLHTQTNKRLLLEQLVVSSL